MAFNDLREFIAALEAKGWLKRIKEPVDCDLEITEITDRVSKMTGDKNVALLFENVKGYDIPVLMNAFGSMERMALALGVEKIDDKLMATGGRVLVCVGFGKSIKEARDRAYALCGQVHFAGKKCRSDIAYQALK